MPAIRGTLRWLRPARAVQLRRLRSAGGTVVRAGRRGLGVLAVALVGATLGILVAGRVSEDLGPFRADLTITPGLHGGTEVQIPPLGSLHLDSHAGPAHLVVRLDSLDQQRTRALVTEADGLNRVSETAAADVSRGVRRLALQVAGVCILGAMALGALVYRSARRIAQCGALAVALVFGTGLTVAGTFRADSITEPRYEGLLANAPAVVGDARRIAGEYQAYRAELQHLVQNVSRLYGAYSTLPVARTDTATIRVLHISDMHLNPAAWSVVLTTVQQFNVDLVIDTGDLTDQGSEAENSYLAPIASLGVPYIFVRGNHDSDLTAAAVARQPNATVLNNSVSTVKGLTIAGIGDPRFTPNKVTDQGGAAGDTAVQAAGQTLADTIRHSHTPVDIALVHDPLATDALAGSCPLVLAGHLHARQVRQFDTAAGVPRTLLMVQGSTGGAGLRALEQTPPLPLALSVLYFDSEHTLQAYDDIRVGGTGQTEVTLERHLIRPSPATTGSPTPSGSTTPSGTPSPAGSPATPGR